MMIKALQKELENINVGLVSIFLLLIMLSAYGFSAFNIQLFGDDWRLVVNPNDMDHWVARIGRWGQTAYRKILLINTTFPPSATMIISLTILCASAYVFLLLIMHKKISNINVIYFCLLFVLCPILINVFNFKLIRIPFAAGVFLIMITVYFIRHTVRAQEINNSKLIYFAILGSFLLMIAISVRQSLILLYIGVLQIIILSYLIDDKKKLYFKKYVMILIIMTFGALLLYVLFHNIMTQLLGIPPVNQQEYSMSKSLMSSPDQIPINLMKMLAQMNTYYFRTTNYWPLVVKVIFLVGYISMIALSVRTIIKQKKPMLFVWAFITISILMLATPFLLGFIRDSNLRVSYKSTSLSTLLLFYPVVYIFLCQLINDSRVRFLVHCAFGYILIIWVFQINASTLTQHFINQRDLFTHKSIISRIETHENFNSYDEFTFVYIGRVNDMPKNSNKLFRNKRGVIHCGVFNCQIKRVSNLFLLTHYNTGDNYKIIHSKPNYSELINQLNNNNLVFDELKLKDDYANMQNWPHASSVNIYQNMALIKLGN